MKIFFWSAWAVITMAVAGYYGYTMFVSDNKEALLIGEATHGHYQIELACTACHTEPFGGPEILQNACVDCHGEELEAAHDSHPKKKFTDPRNADLIDVIDARYCVSCHTEHQLERTGAMGVTLPDDYCYHCHRDVGEDRPSHQDLAFDSCASAGCHNFHDNRALYEEFLVGHAGGPWIKAVAQIGEANAATKLARREVREVAAFPDQISAHPEIHDDWHHSAHGRAEISCGACHSGPQGQWVEQVAIETCATCHRAEAAGFKAGKHGMRLAQGMDGITATMSRSVAASTRAGQAHSCVTCHGAHEFDTRFAATEACLTCHQDQHSVAFKSSPHSGLSEAVLDGDAAAGSEISCATCHLPRVEEKRGGEAVIRVEHNQNLNLRPNEKMIRTVCLSCHSLDFSIDALADENLIKNNFSGKPAKHVPSIDWALKREQK